MKSQLKKELKSLTTDQLLGKVKEDKEVLDKLKFAHTISPIENPMRLKFLKKDIARMLTELNARKK
jgi:large subunit ribosomal protein L29